VNRLVAPLLDVECSGTDGYGALTSHAVHDRLRAQVMQVAHLNDESCRFQAYYYSTQSVRAWEDLVR
jgi:hypothetical protein